MESDRTDNAASTDPPRRKRLAWSTLILTVLFALPWILVSVPGHKEESHCRDDIRWQGKQFVSTFGWPWIHAARLDVRPVPFRGASLPMIKDEVGATPERLDACLHSLGWSRNFDVSCVTPPPSLMPARPMTEFDLGEWSGKTFWSDLENWKYRDDESATKWYLAGAIANSVAFAVYLILVFTIVEFRRRRRRGKLFQLSLLDNLLILTFAAVVASQGFAEVKYGKEQRALASELDAHPCLSASSSIKAPVFAGRLINGSRGWQWLVPDNFYCRVHRLSIDTWAMESEAQLPELQEQLRLASLKHIEYLTFKGKEESHDVILDSLPVNNVYSVTFDLHMPLVRSPENISTLQKLKFFPNLESLRLKTTDLGLSLIHISEPTRPY